MEEWLKETKDILEQHTKRYEDIDGILENLISAKKIGYYCEYELVDENELIWNIKIGMKEFNLKNEEILEGQKMHKVRADGFELLSISKEKKDLEETIKSIILDKLR